MIDHPEKEMETADLFLRLGVRRISASAFLKLTPSVVKIAAKGLTRNADGKAVRQNFVFAKVSRPEVAEAFLSPAPKAMLDALVEGGHITADEAELAATIPVASDITVEADSGGHTDNRPLTAIFPTILRLRDDLASRHGFAEPTRVGAAGGLGTPAAVAAAFQLGAAYVVTGSVNQATAESGLCEQGKDMLVSAGVADVAMAPAADMFELGIKVQVLKRGSIFAAHANKLYDLYRRYDSLDALPQKDRDWLEKQILKMPVDRAWAEVRGLSAPQEQPGQGHQGRSRSETEDGDGLPPPPLPLLAVGAGRKRRAQGRLPDLVRAGDGCLQRLGARLVPREPRKPGRRPDRQEPARRRGGYPACPAAPRVRRASQGKRLRVSAAAPRLIVRNTASGGVSPAAVTRKQR